MKKRYICFLLVIAILIGLFIFSTNKPNNYELEYVVEDYNVYESYNKEEQLYKIKLTKDEYVFYYVLNHKYTSKRKLVKFIREDKLDNDIKCVKYNIFDEDQNTLCFDKKEYMDAYSAGLLQVEDSTKVGKYEDITIYDNGTLYEWNGKGFTRIVTSKEGTKSNKINVLSKEKYDNSLSYRYDNYILFADYDAKNEFKKFYVLDMAKGEISTIDLETRISFDSYFEGEIGSLVYLYDRNNNVQYGINIKKKLVSVTSDSEGATFYDGTKSKRPIKEFKYKNLVFIYDNDYNYTLKNNKLYLNYNNNDTFIRIFDKVDIILYSKGNVVYFLSGKDLYKYEVGKGPKLIASCLEWEFHNESQIYSLN